MKIINIINLIITFCLGIMIYSSALAQSPLISSPTGDVSVAEFKVSKPPQLPEKFSDVNSIITLLLTLVVGIAGLIFMFMLVLAGIKYLTSMGNETATTEAKKMLFNALIGITIVALSWVGGRWILAKLQLG